MPGEISLLAESLAQQWSEITEIYLDGAINAIDSRLGKGYAREHPGLVALFIKVSAQDFATDIFALNMQELRNAVTHMANRY